MTKTPPSAIEASPEALIAEIEALRAKNVELLQELKAVKSARIEAEAAVDALKAAHDTALDEVRALRLDAPVSTLVADVAVDVELFRALWDRHYRFALDERGAIVITNHDGTPAMVQEPGSVVTKATARGKRPESVPLPGKTRQAAFTAEDVRRLCASSPDAERFNCILLATGAEGAGAGPVLPPGSPPQSSPPTPGPQPAPFGLR